MNADLWKSLTLPENPRGHPILGGLLYTFCPAAAGWWRAGADPAPVFEPLHEAHHRRARGETLRAVLEGWGFEGLIAHARKYVEQVRAFREQPRHERTTAPELMPTFKPGKLPISLRNRYGDAANRIRGWKNFYRFIRAWAFTAQDWQSSLNLEAVWGLHPVRVVSSLYPDDELHLPVWALQTGAGTETALLVPLGQLCPLPFEAVLAFAENEAPSRRASGVVQLNENGTVKRVKPLLNLDDLRSVFDRIDHLLQNNCSFPINAFRNPAACESCGFTALCWEGGNVRAGALTKLALSSS